jgi:hypothetical protein
MDRDKISLVMFSVVVEGNRYLIRHPLKIFQAVRRLNSFEPIGKEIL